MPFQRSRVPGQLFDHGKTAPRCLVALLHAVLCSDAASCSGCDAFVTLLCSLIVCSALRLGTTWHCWALAGVLQLPFHLAQWEETYLHVIRTNVGLFGTRCVQHQCCCFS